MSRDEFIGRGWRFPIRVNRRGGLDWSEGPDRVRDAIWLILSTGHGEREQCHRGVHPEERRRREGPEGLRD